VPFSFAGAVIHERILPPDLTLLAAEAKRLRGFAPRVPLDEGLPRTIAWYRAQGWL